MRNAALPLLPPDAGHGVIAEVAARAGAVAIRIAGEPVELFAERALHWPRAQTLFVADVHLGKAAAFRAGGVPVPRGATAGDLARLASLVERTRAKRLVVLGDLLHAAAGRVAALDAAFRRWRVAHAALEVMLVRGNHDARAGDPPPAWGIAVVAEPHPLAPFVLCHEPRTPRTGYALCGHVHPGVLITGNAYESARLPCFVIGQRRMLLPAFGRLTGLALVGASSPDTIIAIAGGSSHFAAAGLKTLLPGSVIGVPLIDVLRCRPRARVRADLPFEKQVAAATADGCRATAADRRPSAARPVATRWISSGTYRDRFATRLQETVFLALFRPRFCASKRPCQA
jgi:DNA ligase-associated metallophosphoesterase